MKRLIAILSLLASASCATTPNNDYILENIRDSLEATSNYEEVLDSWVGSSSDDLVSAWRAPDKVYTNEDGSKVVEFMDSRTVTTGGYSYTTPWTTYNQDGSTSTTYANNTMPVSNHQSWCRTTFVVSKYGIIQSWKWHGNNCKA